MSAVKKSNLGTVGLLETCRTPDIIQEIQERDNRKTMIKSANRKQKIKVTLLIALDDLNKTYGSRNYDMRSATHISCRYCYSPDASNVKRNLVALTIDDYKEIGVIILRSDPVGGGNDTTKKSIVNGWIPMMLSVPLYEDIPAELRGRVGA